jgi:hypothetical protein
MRLVAALSCPDMLDAKPDADVWAESESRKQKLELSIFRVRGYFKYV